VAGIADFLDSLVGGLDLICFALIIGGLLWGLCVLRPWQNNHQGNGVLLQSTVALLYKGAFGLAAVQAFKVVLKIWLMAAVLERWPFPAFASTTQFQWGLIRTALALGLGLYCYRVLPQHLQSQRHWYWAGGCALPMLVAGAWLVHAAGRFDNRLFLMSFTVIHQIGAAAWVGGVFMLLNLWRLRRSKQVHAELWPLLLRGFSYYGMVSVALILLSGLPIALQYINSWNGLVGTGYGNLLAVKVVLLLLALGLAALNRAAVLQYGVSGNPYNLLNRVPFYIEAETFVLITLLFTAASLASQPPAIDIPNLTATWQEVLEMFSPKIPRISSPSHGALIAGEAGRTAIIGQVPSVAATEWSNYNHNISGIFLVVMGFFAMLSYIPKPWARFAQYWPMGFMLLGIFLFFRSDAETWPLGPIGFWDSTFNNGEVLQHRIATLLVFTLGAIELSARLSNNPDSKKPLVFPLLAAFGGLMLLTHSHVGFQAKSAFLIQVGHTTMGIFSLILACGRWLELKLDSPGKHVAGFISVAALFQIGLVLIFYREPLY
jgi:copper resistance protein D